MDGFDIDPPTTQHVSKCASRLGLVASSSTHSTLETQQMTRSMPINDTDQPADTKSCWKQRNIHNPQMRDAATPGTVEARA